MRLARSGWRFRPDAGSSLRCRIWAGPGLRLCRPWADRAEDISRGGSLIFGCAWTRAALGPATGDLVLGRRELHRRTRPLWRWVRRPSRARSRPGALGGFFKILDRVCGLSVMARTSRELAITHGAQFPAQRLLGDDDPEFLKNPLAEIDDPPAHDAVNRWDWTALDDRRQRHTVLSVQPRRLSGALRSSRPWGPSVLNLTTQSRTI